MTCDVRNEGARQNELRKNTVAAWRALDEPQNSSEREMFQQGFSSLPGAASKSCRFVFAGTISNALHSAQHNLSATRPHIHI